MWVHGGQHLVQPMFSSRSSGREMRVSWWRWRPWFCASSINDGAAALIMMSESHAIVMGLKPLARIRGYADAEGPPVRFTSAPSNAVPIAVERAGMAMRDVEYHEINEAFSVVALANMLILKLIRLE